jgi:hypothetical protein
MDKIIEQEWLEKIKQQAVSGKSAAEWCREQSVSYQTFICCRKRLSQKKETETSSFIEISDDYDSNSPTWMEITMRGVGLTLAKNYNRELLRRFLESFGAL